MKISLKFVRKGQINNILAVVQWSLVCWRIYASLVLNELRDTLQTGTTVNNVVTCGPFY